MVDPLVFPVITPFTQGTTIRNKLACSRMVKHDESSTFGPFVRGLRNLVQFHLTPSTRPEEKKNTNQWAAVLQ